MRGSRIPFAVCLVLLLGVAVTGWNGQAQDRIVKDTIRFQDFAAIDAGLASLGIGARLYTMEYITSPDSGQFGGTVFAKDIGKKQLSAHWVPGDSRRFGVNEIYWTTDQVDKSLSVPLADSNAAIDGAMNTWQEVICSRIPLMKVSNDGIDLGYVQWLLGLGGTPRWFADITHAGWLPADFFNAIAPPNGSQYILGVTFTFIWIGSDGKPTDIDGNGKNDVAFREIYYNDAFTWSTAGPAWNDPEVDIETIVLHETGHGLSQAHFGKMFVDASDPTPPYSISHLHFAPRAVMNAVYWDTQRELLGTDVGGHCSIWGSWPR